MSRIQKWLEFATTQRREYHFLVTVNTETLLEFPTSEHPAWLPGAICGTNGLRLDVPSARGDICFLPIIANDFEIREAIDPIKRAFEMATLELDFLPNAPFPTRFRTNMPATRLSIRVDYWTEGMTLEESFPLFWGWADPTEYDPESGHLKIQARDSFPDREVEFPPSAGTINEELFPQIPRTISGIYGRQIIVGPFNYPIVCPQIDETRKRFYIADIPIQTSGNFIVEDAGNILSSNQYNIKFMGYPLPKGSGIDIQYGYSYIELNEPAEAPMGYIVCSNGLGIMSSRPLLFFLDFGKYKISDNTRQVLGEYPQEMSVINSARDTVMKLIMDRLILQTPYILYFQHGIGRLTMLSGMPTGLHLGIGYGLSSYAGGPIEKTSPDTIVNALEIMYKRNIFSTKDISAAQLSYVMDRHRCPDADLANKLELSESQYGRRYTQMQFADIIAHDKNVPINIPIIAAAILGNAYREQRIYTYTAPLYPGFFLPLNSSLTISDSNLSLSAVPVRLIRKQISRKNGFGLTFQTE